MTATTETTPEAADLPHTTYHWIMTVQSRGESATHMGTFPATPDHTREQVFASLFQGVLKEAGFYGGSVLFFDLAPNQL